MVFFILPCLALPPLPSMCPHLSSHTPLLTHV
jgi:hypothetical protein